MKLGDLVLACNNGIDVYDVNGTRFDSPRELRPQFETSVDWFEIEHRADVTTMYIYLQEVSST